jgi:predicted peptidase
MTFRVWLLLAAALIASASERKRIDREVVTNGVTYRYVVSVPDDWTANRAWPVILFLHGSVERGSDGVRQAKVGLGAEVEMRPERWPAVVVMPQCRPEADWSAPAMEAQVLAALEASMQEFHGDSRRVYLTGFSMGGYGTWAIAARHPKLFAALVPISGGVVWPTPARIVDEIPYASIAEKVAGIPSWVFHGGADRNVFVTESREMVKLLRTMNANVRYTEYDGAAHFGTWDRAYAEPELPTWLFRQRLASDPVR